MLPCTSTFNDRHTTKHYKKPPKGRLRTRRLGLFKPLQTRTSLWGEIQVVPVRM